MMTQCSLFDGANPLKVTKPLRLIELFAGIGAQAKALENLGVKFEHYRICEFDKYAVTSYNAVHGTEFTTSDITKIHATDLGIVETDKYEYIMTYSFPCFTADSLVLTDKGYKFINKIQIGDMVLTHDNTYQKVLKIFDNGVKPILKINAMSIDEIKCTPKHKFLVRTMNRVGHDSHRVFSEPYWKEADSLTKKDYLGIAVNQKSIIPIWNGITFYWSDGRMPRKKNELARLMNKKDFWWIIGRYIGDGWIRTQGGIIICCAHNKLNEITQRLDNLFKYTVIKERTTYKIHIPQKELSLFVEQFGRGAINKHLTNTIIDLPCELLRSFLNGYISADGYINNGYSKASSISRELIYGLAQCVAKAYKMPYRIYYNKRKSKCTIENRIVNQHDIYELVWKETACKQDKAFYKDNFIWFPIKSITEDVMQNVYDIEVEKNHSFTIQNTIVHNCTDLSKAGKQQGMSRESGTRSGLLWEVERLLKEAEELPQILLMENVPDVLSKKNSADFFEWCRFLEGLGYTNKYAILNAKDFGIPQNRKRCFMLSWLGDFYYDFPQAKPLTVRLKDVLEPLVDEKYYLSPKVIKYFIQHTQESIEKGNGFRFEPTDGNVVGKTITTRAGSRMDDNFIKCEHIAQLEGNFEMANRVYSPEGLFPTIRTMQGGGLEPKILEDFYKSRNPREYEEVVPTLHSEREGLKVIEPMVLDEQNGYIRKDGTVGTLTTDGSSPKHNNRVVEPIGYDGFNQSIRKDSSCVGTLTRNYGADLKRNAQGILPTAEIDSAIYPTVRESNTARYNNAILQSGDIRIRKLTPKECWRLMGFDDESFSRAEKKVSNSQLYKQAGNSIVVDVLMAIFKNLF